MTDWDTFLRSKESQLKPASEFLQAPIRRNEFVALLSHQKALCFGQSPLDNGRSLRLMECEKCHRLVKHVAFAHHMKRRHAVETHASASGDESQSFLLSPPRHRTLSYVSERKNELLLVLKRAKAELDSADEASTSDELKTQGVESPLKSGDENTKDLTKLASMIDTKISDIRSYSRERRSTKPRMLHPKPARISDPDCVALRTRRHLKEIEVFEHPKLEGINTDEEDSNRKQQEDISMIKMEYGGERPSSCNADECGYNADMDVKHDELPVQSSFLQELMNQPSEPLSVTPSPPPPKPISSCMTRHSTPTLNMPPVNNIVRVIRPVQKPVSVTYLRSDRSFSQNNRQSPSTSMDIVELPPRSPDMPHLEREDVVLRNEGLPGPSSRSDVVTHRQPSVYHIKEKNEPRRIHKQSLPDFQPYTNEYVDYITNVNHISYAQSDVWKQNGQKAKNIRLVPVGNATKINRPDYVNGRSMDTSRKYYLKPVGNPGNYYKQQQPRPSGHYHVPHQPVQQQHYIHNQPLPQVRPKMNRVFVFHGQKQNESDYFYPQSHPMSGRRSSSFESGLPMESSDLITISDDSDSGIGRTPLTDSGITPPSDSEDTNGSSVENGNSNILHNSTTKFFMNQRFVMIPPNFAEGQPFRQPQPPVRR
ncbi:unnamed protein product [Bursaphelenchus xylophilus]|uniref:(pine wood nematode) hypothetical protein n=1 Tax=Bursaphelenchus xylophilus TaxID=6326 RepID=A0A1I7RHJ5_BURXY|nr:unnamed protein product [Bursaphelenchus xylophilus]CAG9115683.1 unnamed protein product [Bursaphelenchus xylophilus]